jgi:hypothetical protein
LIKLDFVNDIQRFIDVDNGILFEYIKTVDERPKDPDKSHKYVEPSFWYKRIQNEVKTLWLALGESDVLAIQVTKVKTPIPITQWLYSKLGYIIGKQIASSLVENIPLGVAPDNDWAKRRERDSSGFYGLLDAMAKSPAAKAHKEKFQPALADKTLPADAYEYIRSLLACHERNDEFFAVRENDEFFAGH